MDVTHTGGGRKREREKDYLTNFNRQRSKLGRQAAKCFMTGVVVVGQILCIVNNSSSV